MNIIIKSTFRNICENRARTILVLLCIVASTALFFGSFAISGTLTQMMEKIVRDRIGTEDIVISPGKESPTPFVRLHPAGLLKDDFEYIIGQTHGTGTFYYQSEQRDVSLIGSTFEDLQKVNPCQIKQEFNLSPFEGKKIIISEKTSGEYNLPLGSNLDLMINNVKHRFLVCGIAASEGYFSSNNALLLAVIPVNTLGKLNGAMGKYTSILLKMKNSREKQNAIKTLSEEYKGYIVYDPIADENSGAEKSQLSATFFIITAIVSFLSIFIIYFSFKVIVMERLPLIGTYRSLGATKKITNRILMLESLMYGCIGGIIGCVFGIAVLEVMSLVISRMLPGAKANISFSIMHLVSSLTVAILLCLIGAIVPVRNISKLPIKEIVLNNIQMQNKRHKGNLIFCLFMVLAAVIFVIAASGLPTSNGLRPFLLMGSVLLTLVAGTLIIQDLTRAVAKIGISLCLFGNEGVLSFMNIRDNKNIIRNITLLFISIATMLFIYSITGNNTEIITEAYENSKYNITLTASNADKNFELQLYKTQGVNSVCGVYEYEKFEVDGQNFSIRGVLGIDKNKIQEYWSLSVLGNLNALSELDDGRNMLVESRYLESRGLKIGDVVPIKAKRGIRYYQITGSYINSLNNQYSVIVSERFLKKDMGLQYYSRFYINTASEPENIIGRIKEQFPKRIRTAFTKEQKEQMQVENSKQMIYLFLGLSITTILLGFIGVVNNLIVCFIQRRRELAILRSIGISRQQTIKMLLIESLSSGLVGGLLGVGGGISLLYITNTLNSTKQAKYSLNMCLFFLVGAVIVTLAASISPIIKTAKLNIITEIRRE